MPLILCPSSILFFKCINNISTTFMYAYIYMNIKASNTSFIKTLQYASSSSYTSSRSAKAVTGIYLAVLLQIFDLHKSLHCKPRIKSITCFTAIFGTFSIVKCSMHLRLQKVTDSCIYNKHYCKHYTVLLFNMWSSNATLFCQTS